MPRKNYDKMYNKSEEPVVTEVTPEEVVQTEVKDILEEIHKENVKKFPIEGKVIGGSLNVRIKPDGNVKNVLSNETIVKIVEETSDWYKIAGPTDGYVMKKFIEV